MTMRKPGRKHRQVSEQNTDSSKAAPDTVATQIGRRPLLIAGGLAAVGAVYVGWKRRMALPRSDVFVARGQRYDGPLATTIRDGLTFSGLDPEWVRGKRVLLKPNLVEPSRDAPHVSTHPSVVVAAAEVFRQWGASVVVGEAPGHVRDTEMALVESGLADALESAGLSFADLNYEDTGWVENRGRASGLPGFHFPRSVIEADLIVSMPKMKTHHWVGVTAAMKNLYGVIPGIRYGWPKNVLHYNGIPQTVFDINASLPQTIAIVDGILCMEGDGPIMGTPKPMGLLVLGTVPAAVDATVARLMQVNPQRIGYLHLAADRLGPIDPCRIQQRGEAWESLSQRFEFPEQPHLQTLRS